MATTGQDAPAQSATADREIVISRVISAPREQVFEAFTDVRHLSRWWGPEGFTTTTRAFEFRVGGEWEFLMHGPDGTDYQEWISWTEIARGSGSRCSTVSPAATRTPSSRSSRSRPTDGDPDRDAHSVPHKGVARRGGREVPRDRGRPADSEPPGCLRHRDRSDGSGGLSGASMFTWLVPGAGFEPARPCGQRILSPPRLPFRHPGDVRRAYSCSGPVNCLVVGSPECHRSEAIRTGFECRGWSCCGWTSTCALPT
jgi:hypothetical protein